MTAHALLSLSLGPVFKGLQRWQIRRELKHIRYQLKQIELQRHNDFHAERMLQGREAVLRSDLHNI